jgi:hypothetical protein
MRIVMTRVDVTDLGVVGQVFEGATDDGFPLRIVVPQDQWEALGSPDEFVLRVRG